MCAEKGSSVGVAVRPFGTREVRFQQDLLVHALRRTEV
jgi:hypothetical protein